MYVYCPIRSLLISSFTQARVTLARAVYSPASILLLDDVSLSFSDFLITADMLGHRYSLLW